MNGAIFYSGRYGSTEEYSQWISEETGLPAFHIDDPRGDPTRYDFVVVGSSVVFYKATIRDWVKERWPELKDRLAVLFTVSGAPPGPRSTVGSTRASPMRSSKESSGSPFAGVYTTRT